MGRVILASKAWNVVFDMKFIPDSPIISETPAYPFPDESVAQTKPLFNEFPVLVVSKVSCIAHVLHFKIKNDFNPLLVFSTIARYLAIARMMLGDDFDNSLFFLQHTLEHTSDDWIWLVGNGSVVSVVGEACGACLLQDGRSVVFVHFFDV
jgi:hypothetical protein